MPSRTSAWLLGIAMRLHRNLAEAVVSNLGSILEDGRYADKVLEWSFQHNSKWGARDRRFVAETTYDIVRWYRLFAEISRAREGEYWPLLAAWCFRKGDRKSTRLNSSH